MAAAEGSHRDRLRGRLPMAVAAQHPITTNDAANEYNAPRVERERVSHRVPENDGVET